MPPAFFLTVSRNRTTPFWQHPNLRPLEEAAPVWTLDYTLPALPLPGPAAVPRPSDDPDPYDGGFEDDDNESTVDFDEELPSALESRYRQSMLAWAQKLEQMSKIITYNMKFGDARFLKEMERRMTGAGTFIDNCVEYERSVNSLRRAAPGTWSQPTGTMFMHARPPGQM